jgi:hypothetical protein
VNDRSFDKAVTADTSYELQLMAPTCHFALLNANGSNVNIFVIDKNRHE